MILFYREYSYLVNSLSKAIDLRNEVVAEENNDQLIPLNSLTAPTEYEMQIQTLTKQRKRVEQFASLASLSLLKRQGEARPFNESRLVALAANCEYGFSIDQMRDELYLEVTGQLKFIDSKISQINYEREIKEQQKKESIRATENKKREKIKKITVAVEQFLETNNSIANFAKSVNAIISEANLQGNIDLHTDRKIIAGNVILPFPVVPGVESTYRQVFRDAIDIYAQTIRLPFAISTSEGEIYCIYFENNTEHIALHALERIILTVATQQNSEFAPTLFIDPIRYNGSGLGELGKYFSNSGYFMPIPKSKGEIQDVLSRLLFEYQEIDVGQGLDNTKKYRLLVIHNYPGSFDSRSREIVQQLCANAKQYGLIVLITSMRQSDYNSDTSFSFIRSNAEIIGLDYYESAEIKNRAKFDWYIGNGKVPETLRRDLAVVVNPNSPNLDNLYRNRVGYDVTCREKGQRIIPNIPIGIDETGNIVCIDYKRDDNFATFICGRARQGKSVLLHTIITGLIENTHPDDIDIWLIDFKIEQFSQYIDPMPPQIKYIIMDNSPEMICDIIDKLDEIRIERERERGNTQGEIKKHREMPKDRYSPAIFVIIDEYQLFSSLIRDNSEYQAKLKLIIRTAASSGFYFIFANQRYTDAVYGLDLEQVSNRISFKTDLAEMREVLEMHSIESDNDRLQLEKITAQYCLVKSQEPDRYGNYLKRLHVLYVEGKAEQSVMVRKLNEMYHGVDTYEAFENQAFCNKTPTVYRPDIYRYYPQISCQIVSKMQEIMGSYEFVEGDLIVVFGQSIRLDYISPVIINNTLNSNILVISPAKERRPTCAVLACIVDSCKTSGYKTEYWVSDAKRNSIYRELKKGTDMFRDQVFYTEIKSIVDRIQYYFDCIRQGIDGSTCIQILGVGELLYELKALSENSSMVLPDSSEREQTFERLRNMRFEKRKEGEPDILTQLGENGKSPLGSARTQSLDSGYKKNERPDTLALHKTSRKEMIEKARMNLSYILEFGPKYGYHFIAHADTQEELELNRVDTTWFKHKLVTQMAREQAIRVMSAREISAVTELEPHHFRYTDGIHSETIRPFMQRDIQWD